MSKRIISVIIALLLMLPSSIPSFAENLLGPDLIVTAVRVKNPYFHAGDDVQFFIDVTNIGDVVCESGSVAIQENSGAVRKDGKSGTWTWSKRWLEPGETTTFAFVDFIAAGDVLEGLVICDSSNAIGDVNKGNNGYNYRIETIAPGINLEFTNIKVSPSSFDKGDEITLTASIKNIGDTDMPYSEVHGELLMGKKVEEFTTVQSIKAGEEVSFEIDTVANGNVLNLEAEVNYDRSITETKYEDNIIKKDIYSIVEKEYKWDNVMLGGGGYVPNIEFHPTDPTARYLAGDVGGAFRYDSANEEWIPLTDEHATENADYEAVAALETDKNNSDIVYIALTSRARSGHEGMKRGRALLRSTDRGETLVDMNLPGDILFISEYRTQMKLDPNNSNVLYVVCPYDGLYRTENAQDKVPKWEKLNVTGFERTDNAAKIMGGVAIDSTSTIDGKSNKIYVSTSEGISRSIDGGKTFELLPDSPAPGYQLKTNSKGDLFVLSSSAGGGLMKFDGNSWRSIPPSNDVTYNSFDINPFNEKMLVLSTNTEVFLTENEGRTWEEVKKNAEHTFITGWEKAAHFGNHISFIEFDTVYNNAVWFGDWFGVWKTDDITEKPGKWKSHLRGFEEFCMLAIVPTNGKARLLIGCMDNCGMSSVSPYEYPTYQWDNPDTQDTQSIDFAFNKPDIVARVGGDGWSKGAGNGGYSLDGGDTWQPWEDYPLKKDGSMQRATDGIVCVASDVNEDGIATVIAQPLNDGVYRSTDYGKTWTEIVSLPKNLRMTFGAHNEPLEADLVNKDVFYAYDYRTGDFYLSRNNGESFSIVNRLSRSKKDFNFINAVPGKEGHVFVATGAGGLNYSRDYGKTFTKIEKVQSASLLSIGKESPTTGLPAVYIVGSIDNVTAMYCSEDLGQSWYRIKYFGDEIGEIPNVLKADLKDFGIVYVRIASVGRGVTMGMPVELDIKPPRITLDSGLEGGIIRDARYNLKGSVTEEAEIKAVVNGKEYSFEVDDDNTFSLAVDLIEGENKVTFVATDKVGLNSAEVSCSFMHDPDYIAISLDQSDSECMESTFKITGSVNTLNKENAVMINGKKVSVNSKNNKFTHTINVQDGDNVILVEAWDNIGNKITEKLVVTRDVVAPTAVLDRSISKTEDALYVVRGTVSEPCTIYCGSTKTQLQKGDALDFEIPVQLEKGENVIEIEYLDAFDNSSKDEITVVYTPTENVRDDLTQAIVYSCESTNVPVIDGTLDEGEWYMNRVMNKSVSGKVTSYGTFGLRGDSKYIYFAARIYDKTVVPGPEDIYTADSIELYFDGDLARSPKYDSNDRQIRLGLNDKIWNLYANNAGYTAAHSITEDGYIIEARIPWEGLNLTYSKGMRFGFDVSVNDNNNGGLTDRDSVFGWQGDVNNWQSTVKFGTAIME